MWKDAHWAYLHYILGPAPEASESSPTSLLRRLPRPPTSSSTSSSALVTQTDIDGNAEPLLRRPHERRHPGRSRRRSARATSAARTRRPTTRSPWRGADGRQDDDLRLLRPRLRAAVVRGQRRQGAGRRRACRSVASGNCRKAAATAAPARGSGATRSPRTAGPAARRRSTSTWPAATQPRSGRRTTRRSATRSSRRSRTSTTRPTRAQQVVLKVLKKEELRERRRHRRAPPEPQRRRRRRPPSAVPVRRGDAGPADRPLAVLRPARLPARAASTWRTTSTCTRRSSPPARGSASRLGEGRPGDRPRPDHRLPDGHPGPENARGQILYELSSARGS